MESLRDLILSFMFCMCIYLYIDGTSEARAYKKLKPVEVECSLISINYLPSTKRSSLAPIFGSDLSFVYYSTGNDEKCTTVWDCGCYGRLTTNREDVYRYAKDKSILFIKSSDWKTEIVGIKNG